MYSIHYILS